MCVCVCVCQEELRDKLERLEERLAHQEQASMEKELLYEQVCRLTERTQNRVNSHRESTLQVCYTALHTSLSHTHTLEYTDFQVAQQVNTYQSKIKETTKKTMALVSELSMQQVCIYISNTQTHSRATTDPVWFTPPQSNALQLSKEVKEKEVEIEKAYSRLQAGQPPDKACAEEWEAMVRADQQLREVRARKVNILYYSPL